MKPVYPPAEEVTSLRARPPREFDGRDVIIRFVYPPIPYRGCDYVAYFDGDEECGPRGWGATKMTAFDALLEALEERR